VQSGFTDANAVTAMLDALGLQWRRVDLYAKGWLPLHFTHAFEVVINGERVYVQQFARGQPFMFQSEGSFFRNRTTIADMANLTASDVRQRQEEQKRAKEQAEEEARQRLRAEEQAAHERQQAERLARERAEEARKAQRAAAEMEAESILKRMSSSVSARPTASNAVELPMSEEDVRAMSQEVSGTAEPTVGKLLQMNARAVIKEQEEAVRGEFGLSLQTEELEGDVIVLTFRG
jgi:hypothetical protein